MTSATPAKLPAWFEPFMRHVLGLGPRPPFPKHLTVKEYGWFFDEKQRFLIWDGWLLSGSPKPRPEILWRNAAGRAVSPGWAGRIRRLYRHPADLPPSPGPQPNPPPVSFHVVPSPTRGRNGLYFYNLTDVGAAVELAKRHGLFIVLLVNETDLTPYRENGRLPKAYIRAQRDAIKQAGVTCVASGWAEPFGDLAAQAAFAAEMADGFDAYLLNIEAGWVFEAGPEAFTRSDAFAPLLRRALGPKMPLSLCPDWGNNIHWKPWLEAGIHRIDYQCYLNEWPHKSPKRAVTELLDRPQHDLPGGIPKTVERGVVYGRYRPGTSTDQPLPNFTAQDDEAGRPPRMCWASEFNDGADASWLAR